MKDEAPKAPEASETKTHEEAKGNDLESSAASSHSSSRKQWILSHLQALRPLLRSRKFWLITAVVAVLIVTVFSVPFTRYKVLGLFLKRDFKIVLQDATTQRMVSGATVEVDGKSAVTGKDGIAELKGVRVGKQKVAITKRHYKEFATNVVVTLEKNRMLEFRLEATGRQVPVSVKNRVGNALLSDVTIRVGDADAQTDKDGRAVIVVPVGASEMDAVLTRSGFNEARVKLKVTESEVPENSFSLTPSGKVYFLSKQSGKVDVVKTNLDGSERQVVLAGTGREEESNTALLASRDWKYLALHARRDSDKSKLYLIETESGKLTTIDEGDATFNLYGWAGHYFVYTVTRQKLKQWESKRVAMKSFNADSKQIAQLNESRAEGDQYGYVYEFFTAVTVFEDTVVFTKTWSAGYYYASLMASKNVSISSVGLDGKNYRELKTLPVQDHYIQAKLYAPKEIVYQYYTYTPAFASQFFEYENGTVKDAKDITTEKFEKPYPTYLLSPGGNHTLWSDARDGKNVLFVGNKDGKDEKIIASLSELTPYGWYSDEYVLVSKKGSELYILPATGIADEKDLLKISNYHRPDYSFYGYGGGYGGL